MGNPEDERQATRTVPVQLTETDVELLSNVLHCYAARGAALSAPDALRIGLRELADRCRPHGINNECSKMEMTLSKSQVVQYAKAYMTLGSSFQNRNAGEADEYISDVLQSAEHNGLSPEDLRAVGQWKAGGRLRHLIGRNDEDKVVRVSRAAFAESNEQLRIEKLTELDGVSWPMASTILHFVFPGCYPIVDIRAMNTLGGPDPSRFNFKKWKEYTNSAAIQPRSTTYRCATSIEPSGPMTTVSPRGARGVRTMTPGADGRQTTLAVVRRRRERATKTRSRQYQPIYVSKRWYRIADTCAETDAHAVRQEWT